MLPPPHRLKKFISGSLLFESKIDLVIAYQVAYERYLNISYFRLEQDIRRDLISKIKNMPGPYKVTHIHTYKFTYTAVMYFVMLM